MSLTPEDIEHQTFKERFRGYDQEEVDRFLDLVADRIVELTEERDGLARRLRKLEKETAEAVEAEQMLRRTLVTAQRAVDEALDDAREQADQLVEEAQERAETLVTEAQEQAEGLVLEARREAAYERQQARDELEDVRRRIEELRRFRTTYVDELRAFMAEQLAELDRAENLPPAAPKIDESSPDVDVPAPMSERGHVGDS